MCDLGEEALQGRDVVSACGIDPEDRDSEVLGEVFEVDGDASLLGEVHHRDYEDHWHAQLAEQEGEV